MAGVASWPRVGALLLGLLLAAAAWSNPEKERAAEKQRRFEALQEARTQRIEAALAAGKAIVVMPLFRQPVEEPPAQGGMAAHSVRVDWQHVERPDWRLEFGDAGTVAELLVGTSHVLRIVEPGRYRMSDLHYRHHRSQLPALSLVEAEPDWGALGSVELRSGSFEDRERYDAVTAPLTVYRRGVTRVCRSIYRETGECAESIGARQLIKEQIGGGVHYKASRPVQVPGLAIHARLRGELASFEVAAGELLIVDSVFARTPAIDIDSKLCQRVRAESVRCALSFLELYLFPAQPERFRKALPGLRHPRLEALLAQLQYRPLQLQMERLPAEPGWGPVLIKRREPS